MLSDEQDDDTNNTTDVGNTIPCNRERRPSCIAHHKEPEVGRLGRSGYTLNAELGDLSTFDNDGDEDSATESEEKNKNGVPPPLPSKRLSSNPFDEFFDT